jgi:hypothetical protein
MGQSPFLGRIRCGRRCWGGVVGGAEEREAFVAERMEGGAAGAEASWGGSDDGGADGVGRRVRRRRGRRASLKVA